MLLASAGSALAAVRYVDVTSANSTPPYTSWATAAATIQAAVDVAMAGDEIVVTNGIYATGGRATVGVGTPNRVAVDKPLSVRSINGPLFALIDGGQSNRCVYLTNSASLSGFTLTNGAAFVGGGVYCGSTGSIVSNCVVAGNLASGREFDDPSVGGGAYGGTLNNCIVYFNTSAQGANYDSSSTLNYCCTTPLPTNGLGKITNAPLFVDQASGNLRLQSNSPCINAGLNKLAPAGPDLDGNPRIKGGSVDIGAYEFQLPTSILSYAWLQQYALPTDGSADTADPDGDGLNNWQEWRSGTDPSNALSALRLLAPVTGEATVAVTWQSIAGVK